MFQLHFACNPLHTIAKSTSLNGSKPFLNQVDDWSGVYAIVQFDFLFSLKIGIPIYLTFDFWTKSVPNCFGVCSPLEDVRVIFVYLFFSIYLNFKKMDYIFNWISLEFHQNFTFCCCCCLIQLNRWSA